MEDIGFFGIMFVCLICIGIGVCIGDSESMRHIRNSCETYGKYVYKNTTITCKDTK